MRSTWRIVPLFLAWMIGGCGGGKAEPTDRETRAAKAPACEAGESERMHSDLVRACVLGDWAPVMPVPPVPWKAEAGRPPLGTESLHLYADHVEFGRMDDEPLDGLAGRVVAAAETMAEQKMLRGDPVELVWTVAIAPDVPRAQVAELFRGLVDSKQTKTTLILGTDDVGMVPAPPDPAVMKALASKLESSSPAQRSSMLAKEIEQRMPACPAVEDAFKFVAEAPADKRCSILARGIANALTECGCPDADPFLTAVQVMVVGPKTPQQLSVPVPVTLDPDATSRAGATWAEIVAGLDQDATRALWVAP